MISLVNTIKQSSIDSKSFSSIGVSSYWGTRTYLQLDLKNGGWSVVRLNLIQRIFRAFFGWYQNTKLEHVLVSVRCEALRRDYSKKEHQIVSDLTEFLYDKWSSHHTSPHFDWRIFYYPKYAKAWNATVKEEQNAPKVPVFGWLASLLNSKKTQLPFPNSCR